MTDTEYIKELERALIFLCESYQAAKEAVQCRETTDGGASDKYTDLWFHFPIIQGNAGMAVGWIATLRTQLGNREENKMSLAEIFERMHKTRKTLREIDNDIRRVVEKNK